MASLLAPPRRSPTTLLNLDCSADLTSYSRSLGPVAQTRTLPISSDALRTQFETHRENVLRHKQALSYIGGASPAQTPMMGHPEIPGHHHQQQQQQPLPPQQQQLPPVPPAYRQQAQQPSAPHSRTQTPVPRDVDAYQPGAVPPHLAYRQLQPQPPRNPPSRTQTPVSRNAPPYPTNLPQQQTSRPPAPPQRKRSPAAEPASEYPPELHEALLASDRTNNARTAGPDHIFRVLEDVRVKSDPGRSHTGTIVGTNKNLHYANMLAANHLLDTGRWRKEDELEVMLEEDGALRLDVDVKRSGDQIILYVRRVRAVKSGSSTSGGNGRRG